MGVQTLDDMDMATPESLYVFFKLPPIPIMDLFERVHDSIDSIHHTTNLAYAGYYSTSTPSKVRTSQAGSSSVLLFIDQL